MFCDRMARQIPAHVSLVPTNPKTNPTQKKKKEKKMENYKTDGFALTQKATQIQQRKL